MTDDKQYIFHEIQIQTDKNPETSDSRAPTLSQVIDLIEVYKNIQIDPRYGNVKHLIPTLRYTVLINELPYTTGNVSSSSSSSGTDMITPRPCTVRLYFETMPIVEGEIKDSGLVPGQAIKGIGLDTVTTNENGLDVHSQEIMDSHVPSDFLQCFFIPYWTGHYASSKVLLNKQQQQKKQQQKQQLYQSENYKFAVDNHKPMKFFLSPQKRLRKISDAVLLAAFAKDCPQGKITKDKNPLSSKQQEQMRSLRNMVRQIRSQCGQIMIQASPEYDMQNMEKRLNALTLSTKQKTLTSTQMKNDTPTKQKTMINANSTLINKRQRSNAPTKQSTTIDANSILIDNQPISNAQRDQTQIGNLIRMNAQILDFDQQDNFPVVFRRLDACGNQTSVGDLFISFLQAKNIIHSPAQDDSISIYYGQKQILPPTNTFIGDHLKISIPNVNIQIQYKMQEKKTVDGVAKIDLKDILDLVNTNKYTGFFDLNNTDQNYVPEDDNKPQVKVSLEFVESPLLAKQQITSQNTKNSMNSHSDSETIPPPPTISPLQQRKALLRSARAVNNNPTLIKCLQDQIKDLQQEMRRQSEKGQNLALTTSSPHNITLIQPRRTEYPGMLMTTIPNYSVLVKMDKDFFEDDFFVLEKSSSGYYKLDSIGNHQSLTNGDHYGLVSTSYLDAYVGHNYYDVVKSLQTSMENILFDGNDKILVQIQPFSKQQGAGKLILSDTFPFQDKDGSSYDKIITQYGGSFVVGKYYQKNPQQILLRDNVQAVDPSSAFYKFISSNEFDSDKYSVVTDLSP